MTAHNADYGRRILKASVLQLGLILTATAVANKGLCDSCHIGSPCIRKLLEDLSHRPIIRDRFDRILEVVSGRFDLNNRSFTQVAGR